MHASDAEPDRLFDSVNDNTFLPKVRFERLPVDLLNNDVFQVAEIGQTDLCKRVYGSILVDFLSPPFTMLAASAPKPGITVKSLKLSSNECHQGSLKQSDTALGL